MLWSETDLRDVRRLAVEHSDPGIPGVSSLHYLSHSSSAFDYLLADTPWIYPPRIIRKLTLRRDFGHSRTRKRLSQIPRQELSELPLHYSSISIILKRSSAHLCARVHVSPCLALEQRPHPAQLLGADAARGFWRWWLQSRRSRCRRWWLR